MEEVLPPETAQGAGFEAARLRQFTVFLDNRVGRLQQLVRSYETEGGRIVALSIQNAADTALVRMICAEPEMGREILTREGFSFAEQDVLAVELPRSNQQPILTLTIALLVAEINIHYAYPLLLHPKGPVLALYVDDPVLAAQILVRKGFNLIAESDFEK